MANGRMERADGTRMDVVEEKKVEEVNPDEIAIDEDNLLEEGIPTSTLKTVQVRGSFSEVDVQITNGHNGGKETNPDEIVIAIDDDEPASTSVVPGTNGDIPKELNPDEIAIDDDEEMDYVQERPFR